MTNNAKRRRRPSRTARHPRTASQAREEPEVSFLYFRSAGSGTFRVVVLGGERLRSVLVNDKVVKQRSGHSVVCLTDTTHTHTKGYFS